MNRPVNTRAQLRRAICAELNMPFCKRYENGYSILTSGTAAIPVDTDLTQANDYWNNTYFYVASTSDAGEFRLVSDFAAGSLILERALPTVPASSDNVQYELISVFSPAEIHRAINRALEEAFPSFYDVNTDQTLIVCEDKVTYDLTTITPRPWSIINVAIEDNSTVERGDVTSATNTTLVDSLGAFSSDMSSDWLISIYDGKGAGQLRNIVTRDSATQVTVDTWTVNPDDTSSYTVWNPSEELNDWIRLGTVRFDQKQYPSKMYLSNPMNGALGERLRIQSISTPAKLSADTDETVVPEEFIVHKALSILAGMKMNDNRADRQKWGDLEERHAARAEAVRRMKRWQPPEITHWSEAESVRTYNLDDPLDWRR